MFSISVGLRRVEYVHSSARCWWCFLFNVHKRHVFNVFLLLWTFLHLCEALRRRNEKISRNRCTLLSSFLLFYLKSLRKMLKEARCRQPFWSVCTSSSADNDMLAGIRRRRSLASRTTVARTSSTLWSNNADTSRNLQRRFVLSFLPSVQFDRDTWCQCWLDNNSRLPGRNQKFIWDEGRGLIPSLSFFPSPPFFLFPPLSPPQSDPSNSAK